MTQHLPKWSGLTYIVGGTTHVLPLYEDEITHTIRDGEDCRCEPDQATLFGQPPYEPDRLILTHHPLTRYGQ